MFQDGVVQFYEGRATAPHGRGAAAAPSSAGGGGSWKGRGEAGRARGKGKGKAKGQGKESRKPDVIWARGKGEQEAAILELESEEAPPEGAARLAPPKEPTAHEGVSVATYNLLHPLYAEKYGEREGVDAEWRSNWAERKHALAKLLKEGNLDVYLLQEVGLRQILDLRSIMGCTGGHSKHLSEEGVCFRLTMGHYECVHVTHPARAARDGVAILVHRRLTVLGQAVVSMKGTGIEESEHGRPYMCAALAHVRDRQGSWIVLASAHFYEKKTYRPEETLLRRLHRDRLERELGGQFGRLAAVVWGGDCNRSYGQPPHGYAFAREGMMPTRPPRTIDWIFASEGCRMTRAEETQRFIDATGEAVPSTGRSPSDHRAEAVVVCAAGPQCGDPGEAAAPSDSFAGG